MQPVYYSLLPSYCERKGLIRAQDLYVVEISSQKVLCESSAKLSQERNQWFDNITAQTVVTVRQPFFISS